MISVFSLLLKVHYLNKQHKHLQLTSAVREDM
jgi:hypothetical protein